MTNRPVHSIEAFPRFYVFSRLRFAHEQNVHVHEGDSADILARLAARGEVPRSQVLFYLDAHSSELPGVDSVADELPLNRELQVISENWTNSIVIIDDFEVADDIGYGFDQYPRSGTLNLGYLETSGMKDRFQLYYPAASSDVESGAKRGSLILVTPDTAQEKAKAEPLLRPVPVRLL